MLDLGLVALGYDEDETTQEPLPIAELVETLPDVGRVCRQRSSAKYKNSVGSCGGWAPSIPMPRKNSQETQERHQFLSETGC